MNLPEKKGKFISQEMNLPVFHQFIMYVYQLIYNKSMEHEYKVTQNARFWYKIWS